MSPTPPSPTKDLTLICQDCGQEFVFTTGEQNFYREKGLEQPKYCLICRGKYQAAKQDKLKVRKNNR